MSMSVWGYVHMSTGAHRNQGLQIPWELELQAIVTTQHAGWEPNSGPGQEQCILLPAEPSLQFLFLPF